MPNFLGGALKWGGRTHFLAKILPGSELSECCSNNALYVHNAFPLQMFSASMGHFSRFLMYILIHSTFPRTLPSCLHTTLALEFIQILQWMGNGQQNVQGIFLLVFMNQGCAINLEHISILLELFPMYKSSTFFTGAE